MFNLIKTSYVTLIIALSSSCFLAATDVRSEALPKLVNCLSAQGAIAVRAKKCSKKETLVNLTVLQGNAGASGAQGAQGAQGPQGAIGADGKLGVYGDGSAGDFVATENGVPVLDSANLQYNNFTIPAGKAISIPSGATIRCRGTFTNNGQISVQYGSLLAPRSASSALHVGAPVTANYFGNSAYTGGGDVGFVPGGGISGLGGVEGRGIKVNTSAQAKMVLRATNLGGGAGGNSSQGGGSGGGFITILAAGTITNTGNVFNTGNDAAGGGGGGAAGGIIVLASATAISNTGNIYVDGGDGSAAGTFGAGTTPSAFAAGGGGAGGIIHFISPANSNTGITSVLHGNAGATSAPVTFTAASIMTVYGGGGGGSLYGNGGTGGGVNGAPVSTASQRTFTFSAASNGEDGIVLSTTANPTSLF